MSFSSILFEGSGATVVLERDPPPSFRDLNLDQVVDALIAGREQYDLEPFFYTQLKAPDAIAYRHEALRDLEDESLLSKVATFAQRMREMRVQLAQMKKLHVRYQKEAWFLEAVETYCAAVSLLARDLAVLDLHSRAFLALREYLTAYTQSDAFSALVDESKKVRAALAEVEYSVNIKGSRVEVSRYEGEPDYSAELERTFARFRQGAVKDHRVDFRDPADMDHVEAQVLNLVARLYPDAFAALDDYCRRHADHLDDAVAAFDREVQFYVAYLEYVGRLRAAGLDFCYPRVSDQSKEIHAHDAFDIALANKLVPERSPMVCNDFHLKDPERIFVVTGPNQGGKTTFARTFGQLHHLASIGCLVPGREAQLHLFDRLFTHFEKEEDITTLSGKLEDDLVRIHDILERATPDSVVVMNESFTSTTLRDARSLGTAVMEQMIERDLLCVYVTFVDELASLGETTVSMVSTVVPGDPASRTYKLVRKPADGLAYAVAIAEKYGLTYERLKERVAS